MKSGPVAVALAGLVVVAGIAFAFLRDRGTVVAEESSPAVDPTTPIEVVQVDALAENPDRFKGEIVLRAAVAGVNEAEKVFGVIDAREFESCGRVDCCKKEILPVTFVGELPKTKTVVRITGRVVRGEKGLVFAAERVDPTP